MAEKKTFVFYKGWSEAIKEMPDDIRLEVYDCIIEYAFSGKVPSLKPMAKIAFNFIKNDIDLATDKYNKKVEINRINGANGGRPKKTENQQISETQQNPKNPVGFLETQQNPKNPVGFLETQQNPHDNDNDNEHDNDILLEKESKEILENFDSEIPKEEIPKPPEIRKEKSSAKKEKFRIPTMAEVQNYCNERKNGISAYSFVNFYQSKGWRVGNQPMKDWKAAVHTWEQKNKPNGHTTTSSTLSQATRR